VTYMIRVRHGGPSSGYVSTGFFGGKHAIIDVNSIKFKPHPRLDFRSNCFFMGQY